MKKEGLENSAQSSEQKTIESDLEHETDNLGKWLSNCIWAGCITGIPVFLALYNQFYILNNRNDLNSSQLVSAILGSFMLSGLVSGSLYYVIRGRKIPDY